MATEIKPTSKELKEVIIGLKATAYDTIIQRDYHQGVSNDFNKQLGGVIKKIEEKIIVLNNIIKEEDEANKEQERKELDNKKKVEARDKLLSVGHTGQKLEDAQTGVISNQHS